MLLLLGLSSLAGGGAVESGERTVGIFDLPNAKGHVEILTKLPSPREFFLKYAKGWGKPVVFKGASKQMAAFRWTDHYLAEKFSAAELDTVEHAKKETRTDEQTEMNLGAFLRVYNTSEIYAVSALPRKMLAEVGLLSFLNCGGFTSYLTEAIMWFSSGGTKSVVHNDPSDNINCLFSGTKRLAFFHPRHKLVIEDKGSGWINAAKDRPEAYGAFSGVDIDAIDLNTYPLWEKLAW